MNTGWTIERAWAGIDLSAGWKASTSEYGFDCAVQCSRKGSEDEWSVEVSPMEGCSYSMLVDFELSLDDIHFLVEKDLWETANVVLHEERPCGSVAKVCLRIRIVETLSAQDLHTESPYRSFQLLCEGHSLFVDVMYLSSIGGKLFVEWDEQSRKGISEVSVTELSFSELECLLDATAKYRQITVTRHNYSELVHIAFRYSIAQVLRAVESFLIDASWINPIRKLEYAANFKLARLGDVISRKLLTSGNSLQILHEYLAENGETLDQAHPDVLLSLNIHPTYIIS